MDKYKSINYEYCNNYLNTSEIKMEKEIRPADEIIRECLIPNYSLPMDSEEDQLRRVLEESETEYEFQLALLESRRIESEREERAKHFARFKHKILQFMKIDKQNEPFYSELLSYIRMYESGNIDSVHVSDEFYEKFRRTLDNMRIMEEDKMRLLELINVL